MGHSTEDKSHYLLDDPRKYVEKVRPSLKMSMTDLVSFNIPGVIFLLI